MASACCRLAVRLVAPLMPVPLVVLLVAAVLAAVLVAEQLVEHTVLVVAMLLQPPVTSLLRMLPSSAICSFMRCGARPGARPWPGSCGCDWNLQCSAVSPLFGAVLR